MDKDTVILSISSTQGYPSSTPWPFIPCLHQKMIPILALENFWSTSKRLHL